MAILTNLIGATGFFNLSFVEPQGLWEALILNVFNWGFLANYGWRVLFFTLCLKLLLSPIDIFQRVSMRKTQKVTEKLSAQLEKLDKQYANDEKMKAQKRQELLQKNGAGMNPLKTCLPMIITLVVFITLFSGLRMIGAYKNANQYAQYYNEYRNVAQCVLNDDYVTLEKEGNPSQERIDSYQQSYKDGMKNYVNYLYDTWMSGKEAPEGAVKPAMCDEIVNAYKAISEPTFEQVKNFAFASDYATLTDAEKGVYMSNLSSYVGSSAVHKIYDGIVESFLWIKNIWAVDAPWVSSVSNYQTFKQNTSYTEGFMGCSCSGSGCMGCASSPSYMVIDKIVINSEIKEDGQELTVEQKQTVLDEMIKEETYNKVMRDLLADGNRNTANGYLVLPILSVVLALLTTLMTQSQQKKSGQTMDGQNGLSMKIMTWTMPLLIGFFSFQYTASFALYLVVSYLVSLLVNVVMMIIYKIMDKRDNDSDKVVSYGRPNFNKD